MTTSKSIFIFFIYLFVNCGIAHASARFPEQNQEDQNPSSFEESQAQEKGLPPTTVEFVPLGDLTPEEVERVTEEPEIKDALGTTYSLVDATDPHNVNVMIINPEASPRGEEARGVKSMWRRAAETMTNRMGWKDRVGYGLFRFKRGMPIVAISMIAFNHSSPTAVAQGFAFALLHGLALFSNGFFYKEFAQVFAWAKSSASLEQKIPGLKNLRKWEWFGKPIVDLGETMALQGGFEFATTSGAAQFAAGVLNLPDATWHLQDGTVKFLEANGNATFSAAVGQAPWDGANMAETKARAQEISEAALVQREPPEETKIKVKKLLDRSLAFQTYFALFVEVFRNLSQAGWYPATIILRSLGGVGFVVNVSRPFIRYAVPKIKADVREAGGWKNYVLLLEYSGNLPPPKPAAEPNLPPEIGKSENKNDSALRKISPWRGAIERGLVNFMERGTSAGSHTSCIFSL